MRFCPRCGGENPGEAAYCGLCGEPIQVEAPAPAAGNARLDWIASFPLLTNRFVLYDTAKALGWAGLICPALVGAMALATGNLDSPAEWLPALGAFAAVLAGLGALFLLVMLVFFGNRWVALFSIGPEGVSWESRSRRGRWSANAAMVAGALAGSPQALGAGLLARSQEEGGQDWSGVRQVRLHGRHCVISVMNSWRVVVRLQCTPSNFRQAVGLIRQYAPHARVRGGEA